jgi:hypothetical protein
MPEKSIEIEIYYEVTSYSPRVPAVTTALPEDCYPEESEEVEFDLFYKKPDGSLVVLTDPTLYDALADKIMEAERERRDDEITEAMDRVYEARRDEGR